VERALEAGAQLGDEKSSRTPSVFTICGMRSSAVS
jgi:hypothetical protein